MMFGGIKPIILEPKTKCPLRLHRKLSKIGRELWPMMPKEIFETHRRMSMKLRRNKIEFVKLLKSSLKRGKSRRISRMKRQSGKRTILEIRKWKIPSWRFQKSLQPAKKTQQLSNSDQQTAPKTSNEDS